MIKVLVVEDIPVVREFLIHILDSAPGIKVIGTAQNGREAVESVARYDPDIITMDIHMPYMDGFEATRKIMETHPVPIVIVSGSASTTEVATSYKAIEAGALAIISRPQGIGHPDYEATSAELVKTVRLMSEIKVVRRWPRPAKVVTPPIPKVEIRKTGNMIQAVVIGASTGGPVALLKILSGLHSDFPAPVLIVQHISPGFLEGLVQWLQQSSDIPLKIASDGEHLVPGTAYIAPDNHHMLMKTADQITLSTDPPKDSLRPAISCLFSSAAQVLGNKAIGILLTGMGKDGARELKLMKDAGAITIVQDEPSSVVFGMPGEAIKLQAETYVAPPEKIAPLLTDLLNGR